MNRPERHKNAVKACANLSLDTEEGLAEAIAVAAVWQTDKDGLYIGSKLGAGAAVQIARFILDVKDKQKEKNCAKPD